MSTNFRKSMSNLHTWAGLILGGLLFAIFWMGSLSVFDRELDQWLLPELRIQYSEDWNLDDALQPVLANLKNEGGLKKWGISTADKRSPYLRLFYQGDDGEFHNGRVDLAQSKILPKAHSLGATGFFFPLHYRLHLDWLGLGYWIVGLAAMAMMALLVSGVVIHKRLFKEFFTLRPHKRGGRMTLDIHNLSSVAFLPFHFLISLSGLIIFISIYFPNAAELVYSEAPHPGSAFFAEAGDGFSRPPSGQPIQHQVPLQELIKQAEQHWQDKVGFIRIQHAGDSNSYVQIGRSVGREVTWNIDKLYFDAATGKLLHESKIAPMMNVQRFFVGLHFIQFDHALLRWLYFIGGIASCVMIGSGYVFWLEARKRRMISPTGKRVVTALGIGSCLGIVLATAAFMLLNRLIPTSLTLAGLNKAELEVAGFCVVWIFSIAWSGIQGGRATIYHCLAIAGICLAAVVANGISTHSSQYLYSVMMTDIILLAFSAVAILFSVKARKVIPA